MQPSGAQGAHELLVRPGDAGRKRKEEKSEAVRISRILSGLTCGFLRRPLGLQASFEGGKAQALLHQKKRTARFARRPHEKDKGKIT